MDQRAIALGNLELARKGRFVGGPIASGTIVNGPYFAQTYEVIAPRHGFPDWYRIILKDESGTAERDIREKYLEAV